ncbi:Hypothetical Protein FCC1311_038652 [Hondaea fermentalgiana]|uniref:Uncharacterized protein n=1 Tax=Hondaea fermentalgiana TaxID=2315210 RepID=A0A2R5G9B9_9STRA|nr:Hypothetical Protein FCC1311_038652 [Hondaea fermentalgiana]|eukprot:GBG27642.1 Hypothetical Protein FCC1311_038652 [Hondaea fermentalgiana]
MVYYVYSSEYEMEPGREFLHSLQVAESGLQGLGASKQNSQEVSEPERAKTRPGRTATSYQELSISERRLGNEAIKSILDRGKTHNGLIARAQASVDTSEPKTRSINRWHNALRLRDPMPELELPKDVKMHSSWTQLAEMKWRKDWHERLLKSTKSNIDVHLPKHVKIYQRRKKEELRKLVEGDRIIA